ncbi:MAG TPA: hypothetical protein VGK89_07965 [Candidatus Eisenbacteria bacterium]|jgi:SAM-dependent methyltransferase
MVHALREAHRVLAPGGILLDLRPASVHRRIGIARSARTRPVGVMRERFEDERSADRAVARVVREGWLEVERRLRFPCRRLVDSVDEFRTFLDDFTGRHGEPLHDWLVRRLERALEARRAGRVRTRIAIDGPLDLAVLRKLDARAPRARVSRSSRRRPRAPAA